MKILAIETSCDETSVAIVECTGGLESPSFNVLTHKLNSQIDLHREYGGVYPTLAKREHSRNAIPLLLEALKEAQLFYNSTELQNSSLLDIEKILEREPELLEQFLEFIPKIQVPDIDAIAVTIGPGLEPALWIGLNFAKALSSLWDKPLLPVNHMEGHIMSVLIDRHDKSKSQKSKIKKTTDGENVQNNELGIKNYEPDDPAPLSPFAFPSIALLISGGHTQLVLVKNWGEYEIIGETRDDAVGEAFDKVARMLELPYPGGPEISRLASRSRDESEILNPKSETQDIKLPRPMLNSNDLDFSFSGLKTSVLYRIKDRDITDEEKMTIAREFEDAVTEVLIKKTKKALIEHGASSLIVGGGVIANTHIRNALKDMCINLDTELHLPDASLTGDNAIMIAVAGYIEEKTKLKSQKSKNKDLRANGNLRL